MAYADLWVCIACSGGPTISPQILRNRVGTWVAMTTCSCCQTINYHTKWGNFLLRDATG
jgi:hypothetical protein